MSKEIGYFDVLKSVITKIKVDNEDIKKHFVPFMTMKWLSNDAQTCHIINTLNTGEGLKYIPKEDEYLYLKRVVRLPKNKYIAFDKTDKDMDKIISAIAKYYKTNNASALDYINILGGEKTIALIEKISQINNKYTTDKTMLELRIALAKKKKEIIKIKGK
jgi:hypothetical protein